MNRNLITLSISLLLLISAAPALAVTPLPRDVWFSGDPADLAPMAGSTWEFTTYYMYGAEELDSAFVIFTDSIRVNNSGTAILGTMLPTCEP